MGIHFKIMPTTCEGKAPHYIFWQEKQFTVREEQKMHLNQLCR